MNNFDSKKPLECYNDSTHKPYSRKNKDGGYRTCWFNHPDTPGAKLCGLCYQKLKNPPKYTDEGRKKIRSKRFTENNPAKLPKVRASIQRRQMGLGNSFAGRTHSEETRKIQKEKVSGPKNSNYGITRKGTDSAEKQSLTMIKKNARGEIIHNRLKGLDHPNFGKKRAPEIGRKISKALTDKPKSDKHKKNLAIAAVNQLPPKKSDNDNEKRCEKLLQDMGVEYFKQDNFPHLFSLQIRGMGTRPDFLVMGKIVLFADGDYVHGNSNDHKDPYNKGKITKGYDLSKKLRGGITVKEKHEKDNAINKKLSNFGFIPLRLWDSDIAYDNEKCIKKIQYAIDSLT